ncbi:MAG TPA: hypothetical protein VMG41_02170 [Gemmatimonadales bacterium]|nr:hypothetical protein [Gemmatimonadales bacterium]
MPSNPTRSRRLALALVGLGVATAIFGRFVEAAPGTAAVWQGVLDSAKAVSLPPSNPLIPSSSGSGLALFFRHMPGARTVGLPKDFAGVAGSLEPADTLRVMLGWEWNQETPLALAIVRNGGLVLDSAVVLTLERQRSTRIVMIGVVIAILGGILLARAGRMSPAASKDAG